MDISNIYGPLLHNCEVVFAAGNYNNVHALLSKSSSGDLHIVPLSKNHNNNNVLTLTLLYEESGLVFRTSNTLYLGVEINNNVAIATLTSTKTIFTLEYSSVDFDSTKEYLSGTLYSLSTKVNNISYIVNWKIDGFSDGDLVIILPLSWYENNNGICEYHYGLENLLSKLNQMYFKGYSSLTWCEHFHPFINCTDNELCGLCIGKCNNGSICVPQLPQVTQLTQNPELPNTPGMFTCSLHPLPSSDLTPLTTDSIESTTTTTTSATIIIIIILLILLAAYVYYFN